MLNLRTTTLRSGALALLLGIGLALPGFAEEQATLEAVVKDSETLKTLLENLSKWECRIESVEVHQTGDELVVDIQGQKEPPATHTVYLVTEEEVKAVSVMGPSAGQAKAQELYEQLKAKAAETTEVFQVNHRNADEVRGLLRVFVGEDKSSRL
ncbi:MAG TPA: hypothetical protein HPP83_01295, partial [Candidatus Hydrogenedentes bacterium]|nr:hypothetical protein [Candidatus Hydrogenedentota bacterium]